MHDIQKCACKNRGHLQSMNYLDYKIQRWSTRFQIRRSTCPACKDITSIIHTTPWPNTTSQARINAYLGADNTHLLAAQASYPWS